MVERFKLRLSPDRSRAKEQKVVIIEQVDIRQMSRGDMDAACKVLGLAFADNPNTLAVTRGDRTKAQRVIQAGVRVAELGRKCSHVMVAEKAGRIVGGAQRRGVAELPDADGREAQHGTGHGSGAGL